MASIKQRLAQVEQAGASISLPSPQPVRAWFLTLAEFAKYEKTGQLPPERDTQPPPPLVLVFSDSVKPVTVLNMDVNEL